MRHCLRRPPPPSLSPPTKFTHTWQRHTFLANHYSYYVDHYLPETKQNKTKQNLPTLGNAIPVTRVSNVLPHVVSISVSLKD